MAVYLRALALLAAMVSGGHAQGLIVQDRVVCTEAAGLLGGDATVTDPEAVMRGNWGGAPFMEIGRAGAVRQRAVVRFDLRRFNGRVATVRKVRLILTGMTHPVAVVSQATPPPVRLELLPLAPANREWDEGTGTAGQVRPGAICWSQRALDEAGWAGAPGCGLAGTDHLTSPSAIYAPTAMPQPGETLTFEWEDPAMLIDWIRDADRNAGFLLTFPAAEADLDQRDYCSIRVYSDDAVTSGVRPLLEIEYETAPASEAGGAWGLYR